MNKISGVEKALNLIKSKPRVGLSNIRDFPHSHIIKQRKGGARRGQHTGHHQGKGNQGQGERGNLPRLGFEGGNLPFYLKIPKEPLYNRRHNLRRQYPPVSLLQLQRMIDLNRIDPTKPIDLSTLCATGLYKINPHMNHFGWNLSSEGVDLFAACINVECQWTNELAISAIERCGGTITTRYFDPQSVRALADPLDWFRLGYPIPRCEVPPYDAMKKYADPNFRGYLADPAAVALAREKLAQKYGYVLPRGHPADLQQCEPVRMILLSTPELDDVVAAQGVAPAAGQSGTIEEKFLDPVVNSTRMAKKSELQWLQDPQFLDKWKDVLRVTDGVVENKAEKETEEVEDGSQSEASNSHPASDLPVAVTSPDAMDSGRFNLLKQRKHIRQVFFGLEPGWFVNLIDKVVMKPRLPELEQFYRDDGSTGEMPVTVPDPKAVFIQKRN